MANIPQMTIPMEYNAKNLYTSFNNPSTVHCKNTYMHRFFQRYLLQKAISVFKWTLPETWDEDYFLYTLYGYGYTAVINTDKFGVIPQWGALGGYNVFYRPTYVIISNPLIPEMLKPTIGIDCTIIKLQPDYGGIMDMINFYADQLALCAESIGINLINSHVANVFPAGDKATAEAYKKMFDQITSGQPGVVVGKNLFDDSGKPAWLPFSANVKNEYIADIILADMQKIEARFEAEIGIPNNPNTDKRERLVTYEVTANNIATSLRPMYWLQQLKKSVQETRDMFGIELSVDWRVNPESDIDDTWTDGGGDSV